MKRLSGGIDIGSKHHHIIPDFAVAIYCDLKIVATTLVSRLCSAGIFINMPSSQNRSNCAFRFDFLRLVTMSTAKSGIIIIND